MQSSSYAIKLFALRYKLVTSVKQAISSSRTKGFIMVSVRLATQNDVDKILHVSEGIYDGGDYIPGVLQQWMSDEHRLIFVAEYEGDVIGMKIATITGTDDKQAFVLQALRIHQKYRGKKLSYQIIDAVQEELNKMFPQIKKFMTCVLDPVPLKIFTRKGFIPIDNQMVLFLKLSLKSLDAINIQNIDIPDKSKLASLNKSDVNDLLNSDKLADLMGLHGGVYMYKGLTYKIPEDFQLIVNEVDFVFVDKRQDGEQDGSLKSISFGKMSTRVNKDHLVCYSFTNDIETQKSHFIYLLRAAFQNCKTERVTLLFYVSGCQQFERNKAVEDEISRLGLDCEVSPRNLVRLELQH